MLRTIKNLFILLIIGVVGSGMPIYATNINFVDLIPTIISKDNIVHVSIEENIISSDHFQIKYGFSINEDTSYVNLFFDEDNPFTMELSSNGDMIPNLSLDDIVSTGNYKGLEFYNDEPVYIVFDFNRENLNLPFGSYDLKLHPNVEGKELSLDKTEFNINYDYNNDGIYTASLSSTKGSQTPLTLYFPDEELNILVPLTRFITYTDSPLTMTLRNLEKGPHSDMGLLNISPIPSNGKAGKVGNTAYINLPKDLGEYNQSSAISSIAVNSLVNSLTSTPGISTVQFQFGGKVVKDAFHGMVMDKPYAKFEGPMIYTSYLSNTNRFLLTPIPFIQFGTVTETYNDNNKIPTIFETLKFKSHGIYNYEIHPIVPNEVELLDYKLNNGSLTLTFNEAFTKVYDNNSDFRQMMIDGIVFTFMSLDDVSSIDIKVNSDSTNLTNITNYDFQLPIYINPEI